MIRLRLEDSDCVPLLLSSAPRTKGSSIGMESLENVGRILSATRFAR